MTHMTRFTILLIILALPIASSSLLAQSKNATPVWWFGGTFGVNFNYYGGEVHALNSSTTSLAPFTKGSGKGMFIAPFLEYRPDPVWGGMFSLGFDSRGGTFEDVSSNGVTASLSTSLNYLSLEPSLMLTPFQSPLYFFAGPRLGIDLSKSFTYKENGKPDVEGDWSGVRGAAFGGQIGLGYEFPLTKSSGSSELRVAPFMAVHFGQGPRTEESWSLSSVRFGVSLKVGSSEGDGGTSSEESQFSIKAPKLIPIERKIKETFPMRNNIFFDEGSDEIPARYVRLTKDDAAKFKEEQLLNPEPKDFTGRSRRQMTAYHNVINVIGDRLRRYPESKITLSGASEQGAEYGKKLAESVKRYFVDVFGIDGQRIIVEGKSKPLIPSMQPGGTHELDLVRPEDRRVDVTSSSTQLLEPVQIVSLQEDPLDSDVSFSVPNAEEKYSSWSVDITDESGSVKHFGPFTSSQERISGRTILGNSIKGSYTIAMIAQTKNGESVRKEQTTQLVRTDQPDEELGLRFSIIFEFDQSKTVATYDRFLTTTVAPLIPEGASVIIHGHTDIVGEESHNLKLSRDRAQETMSILQRVLTSAGKRRVKFDTFGFGEDIRRAPFDNKLPEERFYNRTVIIDIVPE